MPKRFFCTLALCLGTLTTPLAAEPVMVKDSAGGTVDEVEQIRKQLGPEFSIESKEFEIDFERPGEGHRNSSAFGPGQPAPDKAVQMNERLRAMSQATRDQARHLELMAAEAEMKMEYELADRLRDVARRQWESARFMRAPLEYPTQPAHDLKPKRIPYSNPTHPTYEPPISVVPAYDTPRSIAPTYHQVPSYHPESSPAKNAPSLPAPRRNPTSSSTPEIKKL